MVEHYGITLLKTLFSSSEIDLIQNFRNKDRRHPLKRLLFPQDRDLQAIVNMRWALVNVLDRDYKWAFNQKPRLLATDDYSHPASALAEIRAYGFLLRAGLSVTPIPRKTSSTPDFLVEENGDRVFVEVYSKQFEQSEAVALEKFNNAKLHSEPNDGISVRMHKLIPFGEPKGNNENVTMNAIHKLSQIKQSADKTQFSETHPSILWIDFNDEHWNTLVGARDALPVKTWKEELFSGIIWYAFYGWKGTPIFEGQTTEERPKRPARAMPHDGRFNQNTHLDAVIISFPTDTIILENPYSKKAIKPAIWRKLFLLPLFSYENSCINWPKDNLKQRIAIQRETLEALSQAAIYSF